MALYLPPRWPHEASRPRTDAGVNGKLASLGAFGAPRPRHRSVDFGYQDGKAQLPRRYGRPLHAVITDPAQNPMPSETEPGRSQDAARPVAYPTSFSWLGRLFRTQACTGVLAVASSTSANRWARQPVGLCRPRRSRQTRGFAPDSTRGLRPLDTCPGALPLDPGGASPLHPTRGSAPGPRGPPLTRPAVS